MTFFIKLAMIPALVAGVSWIALRLGPRVGGILVGLPLATGPVVLFLSLSHGRAFGAALADGVLRGLTATEAFAAVYAVASQRCPWPGALGLALAAFVGIAAATLAPRLPASLWMLLALGAFVAAWIVVQRVAVSSESKPRNGAGDTPPHEPPHPVHPLRIIGLRAILATALFAGVTLLADAAGPTVGGIVAPIPVVTTVMAVFTQWESGRHAVALLLLGMVRGTASFWAFFAAFRLTLPDTGPWGATLAACCAGLAVQGALSLRIVARRNTEPPAVPSLPAHRASP